MSGWQASGSFDIDKPKMKMDTKLTIIGWILVVGGWCLPTSALRITSSLVALFVFTVALYLILSKLKKQKPISGRQLRW